MPIPELHEYLKTIQPSHHICLFYDSIESKRKVIYPFLTDGLNNGKGIVYIYYEETPDQVRENLAKYGVDVEPNERSGNLKLLHSDDWYMPGNKVEAVRIINNWKAMHKEFEANGLGMRVTGEVSGFFDRGKVRDLLRYEYALHRFLDIPMDAICSYNINDVIETGNSDMIMPLIRAHGKAIFAAEGSVMIMEPDDIEDIDVERLLDIEI